MPTAAATDAKQLLLQLLQLLLLRPLPTLHHTFRGREEAVAAARWPSVDAQVIYQYCKSGPILSSRLDVVAANCRAGHKMYHLMFH